MFSTSTQRKFWTFSGETELSQVRKETNEKFIKDHRADMSDEDCDKHFLNSSEERLLCRHFEYVLREFCHRFQPPMPKYVTGTALVYFKRFYIRTSSMDYHPRDVMLTCVYLACKVEEFNVSINQFVGNLKGDREKFANIVLGFELLLMEQLGYHLTVHNPFRPLEGLMIDIKTRCKSVNDAEKLRKGTEEFLDKSIATDCCMVFAPSQIALAAILTCASREGLNLDRYITETLFKGGSEKDLKKTIYQIKRIKYMVKSQESLQRELVGPIQKKLEHCRNQENNPESEVYKRKVEEMLDDEEEARSRKRARVAEEEKQAERDVLGIRE